MLLTLLVLGACVGDESEVVFETNLTLNGTVATCDALDAEWVQVKFSQPDSDQTGLRHWVDFDCGAPTPSTTIEPGEWTVSAELMHAAGISHAIPYRSIVIEEDTIVPLDFDYGTFAMAWSTTVDGEPVSCAELGSDEVLVVYDSHEGSRAKRFPCDDGTGMSPPMPRSKTYSMNGHLTHPARVYPHVSQTLRLTETVGPTPAAMVFDVSAAQAGL